MVVHLVARKFESARTLSVLTVSAKQPRNLSHQQRKSISMYDSGSNASNEDSSMNGSNDGSESMSPHCPNRGSHL
jgi:hypothetical protein